MPIELALILIILWTLGLGVWVSTKIKALEEIVNKDVEENV